jgi:hypothetical protein
MNEYMVGYTAVGSLIGLSLGSLFYMLGGRDGKWWRRFIGSLVIFLTLSICAVVMGKFNMAMILIYPLLIAGFSFGYGADITWKKVIKRSIFACAVVSSGLLCCIIMGGNTWLVLPFHAFVGAGSIYLGVVNPIEAAAEEVFVCATLNLGLMMYPFIT